ncbi:MAG: hypothetical protein K2N31_01945 [Treponemataceae bacterium]|nr:hypothetical protein [Treponemataceae bacterium]
MNNDTISLRDLLDYIGFDYKVVDNVSEKNNGQKLIKLIDKENVYLGDIDKFEALANSDGINCIVNRFENYWNDYIICQARKDLDARNVDTSRLTWKEMVDLDFDFCGKKLLGYIVDTAKIIFTD